ncbi:MAG: PEPxxWA-CTERM sorting domain-containing protein [Sandarakinorhabdus sp.]|nr:PEPxxWA-CTERM sorting domain-containing protein [Sandarakinorhabdus sp.]
MLGLAAALSLGGAAQAANLVVNGGFETLTNGIGQIDNNTVATGWSSAGYNFVFNGATADTAGSTGQYGALYLWGPANGYANGLGPSPDGGNFAAADGAFGVAPILQTLTGLTVGKDYAVKFYWAGAQQQGFTGANDEHWIVSLGGAPSQTTSTYYNNTGGFSGWYSERFVFKATSATAVLSFLAVGHPDGVPPFSLLDGVSVAGVPEASTWAMLIAGFGLVGAAARRRRNSVVAA